MDRGRDDEGEEILFNIINEGEDNGSHFLNDSGEGMEELDRRDECQTNSGVGPLTKSGEVY